eukprot:gnl/TRDRNA2_/TRDRNA2_44078_c0_seq1.p1 gnl/TRDRNA2_/TRDRNA2_44078_c0~~gnl/TRDRNA2_/TRDRNA2_44078_c0_seq1.p1  ORF type:complete len:294 (-),score=74.40 gnl/TRDRNA2_/TRDRNA2_44078_c0_seq1:82-924(-)
MMRNLPNKYTQQMLLQDINRAGFLGTFDFLYLPIDPDTNANRGYAFINFAKPSDARKFKAHFEGKHMSRFDSNKCVSVTPATLQGFEANHAHYSSARASRDPSTRPLFLRETSVVVGSWIHTTSPGNGGSSRRGGRKHALGAMDQAARKRDKEAQQLQQPYEAVPQQEQLTVRQLRQQQMQLQQQGLSQQQLNDAKQQRQTGQMMTAKPHIVLPSGAEACAGKPPGPRVVPPPVRGTAQLNWPTYAASENSRFCSSCGGKSMDHFRFCQFCGASLAAQPA